MKNDRKMTYLQIECELNLVSGPICDPRKLENCASESIVWLEERKKEERKKERKGEKNGGEPPSIGGTLISLPFLRLTATLVLVNFTSRS